MRVEAGVDNQSLNAEICWLNVEGEVSLAKVWTSGWDILKKNEESLVAVTGSKSAVRGAKKQTPRPAARSSANASASQQNSYPVARPFAIASESKPVLE